MILNYNNNKKNSLRMANMSRERLMDVVELQRVFESSGSGNQE